MDTKTHTHMQMKFRNVLITAIARCLFQLCEACLILKQAGPYEIRTTWWRNLGIMEAENTDKTQYPFLTLPRSQRWWDSFTWATHSGRLFYRHHASWCNTECILLTLGSCKTPMVLQVFPLHVSTKENFTKETVKWFSRQRWLWLSGMMTRVQFLGPACERRAMTPKSCHWTSILTSEHTRAPSPAHDMIIKSMWLFSKENNFCLP